MAHYSISLYKSWLTLQTVQLVASPFKLKMINLLLQHRNAMFILTDFIDYLQSAFSLKSRLVLISVSAIANHDVMLQ